MRDDAIGTWRDSCQSSFRSRGDALEAIDLVDKSLDRVADFVERWKEIAALFAVGIVGDIRADTVIIQCRDEHVFVIGVVGERVCS